MRQTMAPPNERIAKMVKTMRPVVKGSLSLLLRTREEDTKEDGRTLVELERLNAGSSIVLQLQYRFFGMKESGDSLVFLR